MSSNMSSNKADRYRSQLGEGIYMTVSDFKGNVYVHARTYDGQKGVTLNLRRFKELLNHVTLIREAIES